MTVLQRNVEVLARHARLSTEGSHVPALLSRRGLEGDDHFVDVAVRTQVEKVSGAAEDLDTLRPVAVPVLVIVDEADDRPPKFRTVPEVSQEKHFVGPASTDENSPLPLPVRGQVLSKGPEPKSHSAHTNRRKSPVGEEHREQFGTGSFPDRHSYAHEDGGRERRLYETHHLGSTGVPPHPLVQPGGMEYDKFCRNDPRESPAQKLRPVRR
jgi:hypothetical protein